VCSPRALVHTQRHILLLLLGAVPLTIAAFTLPLPFLGSPQKIGWGFVGGATLLVSGLFVYNSSSLMTQLMQKEKDT